MFLNGPLLIQYANAKLGRPFKWGTNDCNTCVLEGLTLIYPEWKDLLIDVLGRCPTKIAAIRYYKLRDLKWEDELLARGFYEVTDSSFKAGDVFLLPFEKHLKHSYICSGKLSISVDTKEGTNLTETVKLLREPNIQKFRKGE